MSTRRDGPTLLALATILALAAALRVFFWYGLVLADPFAYADASASIARGLPVFDHESLGSLYYTQYLRLSLEVPAAAFYWLFGPGEIQSIAFPFFCSLAAAVLAFLVALRVSGDRFAGLIAAFIAVTFPEAVINSTQFLPDTVAAFFSVATVLTFWQALDSPQKPWRHRAILFALTGLLWALAFYARQTALGLALPLAGLVLYRRRFDFTMLWGVPPALAVATAMSLLLLALGGEPFEDIRTVIGEGRGSQPGALMYSDIDWTYLHTFTRDRGFIPLTGVALLGTGFIALTWRDHPQQRRQVVSLLIVIAGLYLYFEHLMRLPSLYSWWKEPRYVLAMVPFLAALAGVGLTRWRAGVQPPYRRAVDAYIAVLLASLLAFNVASVDADHDYWRGHRVDRLALDLANFLDSRPEQVVYTWDDDLSRYMSFHTGLDRTSYYERLTGVGYTLNRFDSQGRTWVTPGSLVVISPHQDHWSKPTAHAPHWEKVWSDPSGASVWLVPEAPGPVTTLRLSTSIGANVTATAAGLSSERLFPQQHAVLTLSFQNSAAASATISLGLKCGESTLALREVNAAPGMTSTSLDFPTAIDPDSLEHDCSVMARTDSEIWRPLLPLEVGFITVFEPELNFSFDPELERDRASGWYRFDNARYEGGRALVAIAPWQPLRLEASAFPGGEAWVDLGLYDYGESAVNGIQVEFGGPPQVVEWSEPTAGVIHRVLHFENVQPGATLIVSVLRQGQQGLIIDDVVVSTIPPPSGESAG